MATQDDDHDDQDPNPFTQLEEPAQESPNHDEGDVGAPQKQQQHYLESIDSTLVITHIPSQGLSFQIWPAATTLVNLLQQFHQHPTTGPLFPILTNPTLPHLPLRILELGSGTGLVGIAAAAILGAEVTITDLPHVVSNLQVNANANSDVVNLHGGTVNVSSLRWGEVDDLKGIAGEFDIILGSDLVYHDHLFEPLLQTLRVILGGEKNVVFVMAHLKRWKKESVFFKKAKKLFDVQVIHSDTPSNGDRIGVVVYSFVGKSRSGMKSPEE